MIDSTKKINPDLSEHDRNQLINRIDELEKLLAKKKAEAQQTKNPRLKIGSDGIPVLVETVSEQDTDSSGYSLLSGALNKDDELINDIIKKVDEEISQDLDELIVMLKDSIIDEVKTRILDELHNKKK